MSSKGVTVENAKGEPVTMFSGVNMSKVMDDIAEFINGFEFGTVFSVHDLGNGMCPVVRNHENVLNFSESFGHEPEKLDEPGFNIDGYKPIKGLTGQHGYDGAMMHTSEFFSGGLASMCAEMGGKFYLDYAEYETLDGEELTNEKAEELFNNGIENIWELEGYNVEPAGWFLMHKSDD